MGRLERDCPGSMWQAERRDTLRWLAAAALIGALGPARGQALPRHDAAEFVHSLWQFGVLPAARSFQASADRLVRQLEPSPQAIDPAHRMRDARQAWTDALASWLQLTTVALGPVVERRSVGILDFDSPRPERIRQAVEFAAAGPLGAEQMEQVGSSSKGLPALEWLLWSTPAELPQDAAMWHYLLSLARDLATEAQQLHKGARELAGREIDPRAAADGISDFLNQLVGAVETLRWRDIERPLLARVSRSDGYPRQRSGQTALAWASAWQAIQAACRPSAIRTESAAGRITLMAYLRGLGHEALAHRLDAAVQQAEQALARLRPQDSPVRQRAAIQALLRLRKLLEEDVARALGVQIGFTDNDGD